MTVKIQIRRGTSAQWAANSSVVLGSGEPGYDTTERQIKIGDGTTPWSSLPFTSAYVNINDLEDVIITSPATGQVIKYNGTNWVNGTDSGLTYAVSAETATGGANLRLTGSDTSVDNVKFAEGSNVTITRTDANTITIASSFSGLSNVVEDTSPQLGGNLDVNGHSIIGDIISSTTSTYDLGSSTVKFNDLFLHGAVNIGSTSQITTAGNNIQMLTPGGYVELPAGSTVGGVSIGALNIQGTVADYTALLAVTGQQTGDCYVVTSPAPSHLWTWDGSAWVDLGAFQGPAGTNGTNGNDGSDGSNGRGITSILRTSGDGSAGSLDTYTITYTDTSTSTYNVRNGANGSNGTNGTNGTNGQGVPTGGTTGQYLRKTSGTDYATEWDTVTLSDLGISDGTNGQVLTTNGSGTFTFTTVSGGGGGTGLGARQSAAVTSGSIANNATWTGSITGFKTYALLKIQTSAAAWVRLYTDAASLTADGSRSQGSDPLPGAGVIAEVITTGAQTILISPGTIGFNAESSPTTAIPVAVTNLSGATGTITVTLTVLQLEA